MPSPESPIDKSSMHRYCFYYQQGLNAESWSSPNAFLLQGNLQPKSPITLDLVKRSFPFGKMGTYHWRFRETCKEGGFIWRDVKDDAEELPKFQGVVFAKILRLDKLPRVTPTKIRINLSKKASRPASTPGPSASTSYSQASQQRPAPYSDHPPTKVQMPTVAEAASEPEAPPRAAPIAPAPAPPPVPETRVERLQRERKEREKNQEKVWDEVDQRWVVVGDKRNRSISPKPKASTTPVNDLLGGGTGSRPPSSSAPPPQMETVGAKVKGIKLDAANAVGKSANVAAGVQKRVKDMEDAQAKAKQELKDREDGKQRDAAELDAVRAQLEVRRSDGSERRQRS